MRCMHFDPFELRAENVVLSSLRFFSNFCFCCSVSLELFILFYHHQKPKTVFARSTLPLFRCFFSKFNDWIDERYVKMIILTNYFFNFRFHFPRKNKWNSWMIWKWILLSWRYRESNEMLKENCWRYPYSKQ